MTPFSGRGFGVRRTKARRLDRVERRVAELERAIARLASCRHDDVPVVHEEGCPPTTGAFSSADGGAVRR
jgi:hypothetical protein